MPKACDELKLYSEVTKDNISLLIATFNKYKANFAHWIDMDDLSLLEEKPNGYQVIREIWRSTPENIGESIESANNMANLLLSKRFSPSTYAYLLGAKDSQQFSIYRDVFMKNVLKLSDIDKSGSLKPGEKYQLSNDSMLYIGELMAKEKDLYADRDWYTALNGQDFLYITIQYPSDNRKS